MPIVGRLDQYGSMLVTSEFDEVSGGNVRVSGLGTYYASEFKENVGIGTTTLGANVFPPYNTLYDEFAGVLYGPGQGTFMRQELTGNVIVYNEINEIGLSSSYSITPSSNSILEAPGATCTFTVNTTNVPNGTTLFYGISGTNITSSDFTDNTLTGSYTINSNTGSFTKTIQSDATFEGDETFTATVRTSDGGTIVATSSAITIVDAAYAASFNGSSQALAVANNGDFATNQQSYTIEFFINTTTSQNGKVFSLPTTNGIFSSSEFSMEYNGGTGLINAKTGFNSLQTTTIVTPGWNHVALVYNANIQKISLHFNGIENSANIAFVWGNLQDLTAANGFNFLGIGASTTDGSTISIAKSGNISNFRWVVGSALYSSSNFTVPSVPLTAVTGTKLLLLNGQSSSVSQDNSGTNKTITNIGSVPKVAGP